MVGIFIFIIITVGISSSHGSVGASQEDSSFPLNFKHPGFSSAESLVVKEKLAGSNSAEAAPSYDDITGPSIEGFFKFWSETLFGSSSTSDDLEISGSRNVVYRQDSESELESESESSEDILDDPTLRLIAAMTFGGLIWQYLAPIYTSLTVTARRQKRSGVWYKFHFILYAFLLLLFGDGTFILDPFDFACFGHLFSTHAGF